ncbi:MAG TPA: hypothetical protein VEI02_01135 [Planctomycetota bacterium]|nr:hypothetical protein [Planctomycetota bacterium]
MRTFVLGVLVSCGLFAAMGWKFFDGPSAGSAGDATTGTLQSVSSLTLDRLKRIPFNIQVGIPATVVFPSNYGVVIERFQDALLGNPATVSLSVNGVNWGDFPVGSFTMPTDDYADGFRPPLVFRPGDSVTMTLNAQGFGSTHTILMTAWEVGAGEV